MQQFWTSAFTR